MTTPQTQGLVERLDSGGVEILAQFMEACADYFSRRPTGGEDMAHWANVHNAATSKMAAQALRSLASRNEGLEEALRPLARAAGATVTRAGKPIEPPDDWGIPSGRLTMRDARRARQALSPEEGG